MVMHHSTERRTVQKIYLQRILESCLERMTINMTMITLGRRTIILWTILGRFLMTKTFSTSSMMMRMMTKRNMTNWKQNYDTCNIKKLTTPFFPLFKWKLYGKSPRLNWTKPCAKRVDGYWNPLEVTIMERRADGMPFVHRNRHHTQRIGNIISIPIIVAPNRRPTEDATIIIIIGDTRDRGGRQMDGWELQVTWCPWKWGGCALRLP
mmetsp:Transcript_13990/g.23882  ORF Transcript_13990/g.23882 Transcript_13990/m.23882 type:complete len:208 (-) Transcript_13990:441-1064(-)